MSEFFERLRKALLPDYELLRELGSGGMGTVFLVRELALDSLRAVKVLRAELYTAEHERRFVNEARMLAQLRHPNIVVVHKADERDGLNLYVMDYLEGETLQSRLESRGRMSVEAARKFGRDLLDAIAAAHLKGVIHRDVKPGNVFLGSPSAVLTDFGIARRLSDAEKTDPRIAVGTAAYMAPEQFAGVEADALTDIYAAGMTIYEAFTGVRWAKGPPESGSWSGVPRNITRVLQRALMLERDQRWSSADAFRRALWHSRVRKYVARTIALTVGGLVVGALLAGKLRDPVRNYFTSSRIQVQPLAIPNAAAAEHPRGDSIACALSAALARYPEIQVRGPCEPGWGLFQPRTVLDVQPEVTGQRIALVAGPSEGSWKVLSSRPAASWPDGMDDLAAAVFDSLFGSGVFLDASLPPAIRPKTPAARKSFLDGEHYVAQARWDEAYAAYGAATAVDSTCLICYWRHAEVGRWLSLSQDPADVVPYRRDSSVFPETYRGLIAAEAQPLKPRLEAFGTVVRRWPDFFFGRFRFADESYHRGPLIGRERRESITQFGQVLSRRRYDFGPAWEHLAWAYIAEGDSTDADSALAHVRATGATQDPVTIQIRALTEAAFACRFLAIARCRQVIAAEIEGANLAGGTTLDAGARWLPCFDAQVGAIELGRILERQPALARSALLAQALGAIGLGRLDSARAVLRRAADRFGDSDLALFADELEAALVAFDPDTAGLAGWPAVAAALTDRARLPSTPQDQRARAAWMLAIASSQLGNAAGVAAAQAMLQRLPVPGALSRLLAAVQAAARNDVVRALAISEPLIELEATASDPDPYFRTVLHLLRTEWYERGNDTEGARRELVWYQNSDVFQYPVDRPQLAEVDWAFGTLARWRIAQLTQGDAACRASRDVERLWAGGDARYRARADSAARLQGAARCRTIA